jgi:hypothetical protein
LARAVSKTNNRKQSQKRKEAANWGKRGKFSILLLMEFNFLTTTLFLFVSILIVTEYFSRKLILFSNTKLIQILETAKHPTKN